MYTVSHDTLSGLIARAFAGAADAQGIKGVDFKKVEDALKVAFAPTDNAGSVADAFDLLTQIYSAASTPEETTIATADLKSLQDELANAKRWVEESKQYMADLERERNKAQAELKDLKSKQRQEQETRQGWRTLELRPEDIWPLRGATPYRFR